LYTYSKLQRFDKLELRNPGLRILPSVAGTSKEKIEAFLKKANDLKMIKIRYFEKSNNIQIEYYFWTQQGYTEESVIDAINEFLLYVGDCLKMDTEKILA